MVIVVDPRVFLSEDSDRSYLLQKCLEAGEEEFRVGMNGALWDEYQRYADKKNAKFMNLLQRLWFFRNNFTAPLKYNICPLSQAPLLTAKGCDVEIEPTMLGAGLDESEPLVVYLPGDDIQPQRVFPTCIPELQSAGLGRNLLSPREAHRKILLSHKKYPENPCELEKLLDDHRVAGKRTERQDLEFKGPKEGLTTGMRRDIAEAVCGMLRGGNGWVLVGVRSDGEIVGFKPKVVDDSGNPRKGYTEGYDDTHRAIRQEIERIQPSPRELFNTWPIDLNNGRIVVVIWVLQGDRDYAYEGKRLKRKGTETLKIIPVPPG